MRKRTNENTENAFLLTYPQAAQRYNIGLCTLMRLAKECGAVVKLGKSARVIVAKMDDYLLSFAVSE